MKFLIFFILVSCTTYDGNHTSTMFANGVRAECADSAIRDNYNLVKLNKCEDKFWQAYCFSNVGEPDKDKCNRKKRQFLKVTINEKGEVFEVIE